MPKTNARIGNAGDADGCRRLAEFAAWLDANGRPDLAKKVRRGIRYIEGRRAHRGRPRTTPN